MQVYFVCTFAVQFKILEGKLIYARDDALCPKLLL